jgi:hypothetical protein
VSSEVLACWARPHKGSGRGISKCTTHASRFDGVKQPLPHLAFADSS